MLKVYVKSLKYFVPPRRIRWKHIFGDGKKRQISGRPQAVKAHATPLDSPNCPFGIGVSDATAVPLGLGSNPGKGMDVCKCILPLRHGGTQNRCRATSPLVRLEEGEERVMRFQNVIDSSSSHPLIKTQTESLPEPDEINNLIEEVVDPARQCRRGSQEVH
ncbi:hypothetical protein TNCV_4991101 [Trichonephila clavipes]|nr:hypothetical protein TNCV_4991101 [Trichonephila clavipes]